MGQNSAIELSGVSKAFRDVVEISQRRRRLARYLRPVRRTGASYRSVLNDLSFEIERGEFFGILGRNGSGKSTLLRIMAGIYRPDSGTVESHGSVGALLDLGIGFSAQLSVAENAILNAVILGRPPDEARADLPAVLEYAGLTEFEDHQMKTLSSGMRVRLGFSVMRRVDPNILLIDEILAVGDAEFRERSLRTFQDMRDSGRTIVLVTHQMAFIRNYCDRAMLLHEGGIELIGRPTDVIRRYGEVNGDAGDEEDRPRGLNLTVPRSGWRGRLSELAVEIEDRSDAPPTGLTRIHGTVVAEAATRVRDAGIVLTLSRGDVVVYEQGRVESAGDLLPGASATFDLTLDGVLAPGRYELRCALAHRGQNGHRAASNVVRTSVVLGGGPSGGALAPISGNVAIRSR